MRKTTDPEKAKYQDFIKQYLTEQGVPLSPWKDVQPLYLRYRARCLKMKPSTYQAFLNLCLFESNRHCKYNDKGVLKEGEEVTTRKDFEKPVTKDYAGTYYTGQRTRMNYKLNYKAPPKREDFKFPMEWRRAYHDWSYLKDELADYAAVKAILNKPTSKGKPDRIPNENGDRDRYHSMFELPWLIKFALRCLGGLYPIECFPESLSDYREELQELLNKQREVLQQEPVNFPWNTNWNI